MQIIGRLSISLLTVLGLAASGCGTTNNISSGGGTSGLGQSCQRTFDCTSGLVCEANICLAGSAADASTADGAGAPTGDSGTAPTAHLGLIGESCQTSGDCSSPLACIGGSCASVSYALTATGQSCTGECKTAADCCELPAGYGLGYLDVWYGTAPDGGLGPYHPYMDNTTARCEDLLAYLGGSTAACGTPAAQLWTGLATGCFDYSTYCSCAPNTWACNANTCVFAAPCSRPGVGAATTVAQCPLRTRTGRSLGSTCSAQAGSTIGSCAAGCVTATDCAGIAPYGAYGTACSAADAGPSDCTCYQSTCYFKCSKDLDCAGGSVCDTATSLCKSAGCQVDSDCVKTTGNAQAKCVSNACEISCTTDVQCAPPSTICSAGFCKPSGCSSDTDCTGGSHYLCVPTVTSTYSSAVTN